jgi:hypothetical protein
VSSDFHLLQNIYIISATHDTYIKTTCCLNCKGLEKPEIDYVGQSTPSGMVCMCIDQSIKYGQPYTWRVCARKTDILKNSK